MRHKNCQKYILIFFILYNFSLRIYAAEVGLLPYKKNLIQKILTGEIFSESKVKDEKNGEAKTQSLKFNIAGLHPKSCDYALKKLSLYEHYSTFLDFVKISQYNEKTQELNFLLSHRFLPYDMRLIFSLPRIREEGIYTFEFKNGFLKNLKGSINVSTYNSRCLFFAKADWSGPDTGIHAKIFETFSQVLARFSMEKLFRISSTLSH